MWETPQLSERLASLTGQHIGIKLTVAAYRHVAIGLGRKIKGLVIRRVEIEMGERQETENGVGKDTTTGERRESGKMGYIWNLQSTHGSAVARGHYALDVRFPNQLQAEMIANYREISRLWHQFLMGREETATKMGTGTETETGTESDGPTVTAGEIATRKRKRATATGKGLEPGKQRRRVRFSESYWRKCGVKDRETGRDNTADHENEARDTLMVVLPTGRE
jgi:hypothetical protein